MRTKNRNTQSASQDRFDASQIPCARHVRSRAQNAVNAERPPRTETETRSPDTRSVGLRRRIRSGLGLQERQVGRRAVLDRLHRAAGVDLVDVRGLASVEDD